MNTRPTGGCDMNRQRSITTMILAGALLASHLRHLGYHVTVEILRPNEEWGELEDRQREREVVLPLADL
ncbi:MAG TPA: hypothetical protein PL106_03690, partial [Flavobacteriales bacterium]|nr:hypothetical protein [Flavobacteriales bacterium]